MTLYQSFVLVMVLAVIGACTIIFLALCGVVVKDGESAPDFDVELWYIYRIKNAELIRAFLPEELIDNTINEIRKCILVETKTSITLDYKEEE